MSCHCAFCRKARRMKAGRNRQQMAKAASEYSKWKREHSSMARWLSSETFKPKPKPIPSDVYIGDKLFAREWRLEGRLHRTKGPAIEFVDGTQMWYLHGVLHREGKPAIICADGLKSYYEEGEKVDPPARFPFVH